MLPETDGAVNQGRADGVRLRMSEEPGAYRLYLNAYNEACSAATADVPLLVKGEVRPPMPFPVYEGGFEGIVLQSEWQRYRIPLKQTELSSIKAGFVITPGSPHPWLFTWTAFALSAERTV